MKTARPMDPLARWSPPGGFDDFQKSLVLSAFPHGSTIADVRAYRPGCEWSDYPLRVLIVRPDGAQKCCVLKMGRVPDGIEREAALLPELLRLGLPVPPVLAGPTAHPDNPDGGRFAVYREIPGRPLPFVGATLAEMDLTCRLLAKGVDRLHGLTEAIRSSAVAKLLPEQSLERELQTLVARAGPWLESADFTRAIDRLRIVLPDVRTPLVFSNGDYNATNFLTDGADLVGWIDFEGACFDDPYVGFCKYKCWGCDEVGWGTGVKSGLVERYLYAHGVSPSQFAPRLALMCLWTLVREEAVSGGDGRNRDYLFALLSENMAMLS